jgi:MoxR-like ATPase
VFFERTLTRFTTPEELFGPLSLKALEDDRCGRLLHLSYTSSFSCSQYPFRFRIRYERQTTGFLPSARVAFLDEIFKASSAILNTLLGVLNERTFDQGPLKIAVPLQCCVAASNELPDSEDTEALYDRFLIRRLVSPVSDGRLNDLLLSRGCSLKDRASLSLAAATTADAATTTSATGAVAVATAGRVSLGALATAVEARAHHVEVPAWAVALLGDLRRHLRDDARPPTLLSDRRLCQAVDLLRVAAAANGRATVAPHARVLVEMYCQLVSSALVSFRVLGSLFQLLLAMCCPGSFRFFAAAHNILHEAASLRLLRSHGVVVSGLGVGHVGAAARVVGSP